MAFEKLTALAKKSGHNHLSLEFLVEFKECVPEFEDFMSKGRELFSPLERQLEVGDIEAGKIEYLKQLYAPGELDIVGDGVAPDGVWSVHLRDGTEVKPGPLTWEEACEWVDDHTGDK